MHFIDILIIVTYLIATLYIGFGSGKKIKTFNDYAIGNRKFSDFAIYCTVAATIIGGTATMGNVGKIYEIGITQLLAQIGEPLAYIMVGAFLAPRFCNYYGSYTLGDMFQKSYGTKGKILIGIISFAYSILGVGVQFMAMGTAISVLTKFSYTTSLLIGASIILIYTGRGGIRAVTFTDVLQFIVLIIALPMLLIVVINKIGGIHALFEQLPRNHITISNENLHRYIFLTLPMMLPTLSPHHAQRLLMTRNRSQGSKAYYNMSWTFLFVIIMALFLGLSARVLFPTLARSDQALLALITNCLPVGVFGVAVIGILAVLMSSADSVLNCGGIILVNDIIMPFVKHDLSEKLKLKMVRITSIIIGIIAIFFASQRSNIFETRILVSTLWLSVILFPLYFLLFNMKISVKGLFISAIIGFVTANYWNLTIKPILNIDGLFPGFFANITTVFFFYILGGRQKVFTKEQLETMRHVEMLQIKKQPSIQDLQIKNNIFLGSYLIFLQLMTLIIEPTSISYPKLLLIFFNGIMSILLIFGNSLEVFTKPKYFQWLKLITLFLCLPVTSAYLFLTSTENGLNLITLFLSLIIMFLSVDKKQEPKMAIVCGITSLITFIIFLKLDCVINWPEMLSWYHSFYILGFIAVLLLLRSHMNILRMSIHTECYNMARNLTHDLTSPLLVLHLLSAHKKPSEFNEKECQIYQNVLSEMSKYVKESIPGTLNNYHSLKPENLNQCIINCIEKNKILHKDIEIRLQANETTFAHVDTFLFRRIINNLLNICIQTLPNKCNNIIITLNKDQLGNQQILFQTENDGFSAKALHQTLEQNQKLSDELHFGIGFPELQNIVENWHGTLDIIVNNNTAKLQIILPNKD